MNIPKLQIPTITKLMTEDEEYFGIKVKPFYQDINEALDFFDSYNGRYDIDYAILDRYQELFNNFKILQKITKEHDYYTFAESVEKYINEVKPIILELNQNTKDAIDDLIYQGECEKEDLFINLEEEEL